MGETRDDVIFELGQLCVSHHIVSEVGMVTNPVREREKLAPTAIGEGIALPHCRVGQVNRAIVLCGLLRHPVDWDAPDGRPVDLVFLVLSPETHPEDHLKAIQTISLALKQGNFRSGLDAAFAAGKVSEFLAGYDDAAHAS